MNFTLNILQRWACLLKALEIVCSARCFERKRELDAPYSSTFLLFVGTPSAYELCNPTTLFRLICSKESTRKKELKANAHVGERPKSVVLQVGTSYGESGCPVLAEVSKPDTHLSVFDFNRLCSSESAGALPVVE